MASPTRKVKVRRNLKHAALGKRRKNYIRKYGSTAANLPLDRPNANEIKQHATLA